MKKINIVLLSLAVLVNASCQERKSFSALEDQNKGLVKSYFSELGKTKPDDLAVFVEKYVSPDIVLHLPREEVKGRDGLENHYSSSMKTFPNFEQPIYDIIVSENKVAFRGEFIANQANGIVIKTTFTGFWKIQNGKITEWWSEYDALGMLQQLGMELQMKESNLEAH